MEQFLAGEVYGNYLTSRNQVRMHKELSNYSDNKSTPYTNYEDFVICSLRIIKVAAYFLKSKSSPIFVMLFTTP